MRHDEAEDMGFGMRKERSEPVMVNTSPPATQRDRWMYEQGRLAERDPRTHADIAWELAEKVRRDLDRQSCPDVFMRIVVESIVKNFTTQPAAQPAPVKPVAWINAEKRTFEWNGPVLWNTPTVAVLDKIPLYTTPPAAQRRIEELEAMLERQTARIVDLQTHIENLEGEE